MCGDMKHVFLSLNMRLLQLQQAAKKEQKEYQLGPQLLAGENASGNDCDKAQRS